MFSVLFLVKVPPPQDTEQEELAPHWVQVQSTGQMTEQSTVRVSVGTGAQVAPVLERISSWVPFKKGAVPRVSGQETVQGDEMDHGDHEQLEGQQV